MSRKRNSVPLYQRHSSGRARVRTYDANGKRIEIILPGEYGSEESKAEYARVVAQLAVGKGSLPAKTTTPDCTISELVFKYTAHAEGYYVDPTTKAPTSELAAIMEACRPLRRVFGPMPVNDFDSVCLEAIQEAMATRSTWTAEERETTTRGERRQVRSRQSRCREPVKKTTQPQPRQAA